MHVLIAGATWIALPGQDALPEADRAAFGVTVPTYYQSIAFRDRMAREVGPAPQPLEILNELLNVAADVFPEAELGEVERVGTLAVVEAAGSVRLERADRQALADIKRRVRRDSARFRELEAEADRYAELRTVEFVREFTFAARGLVDPATGEPIELETEDAGDTNTDGSRRRRLTRAAVEWIGERHIDWLANRISGLSHPRGIAAKNFNSRPSATSSTRPSSTVASTPGTAPLPMATNGSSPTSATPPPAPATGGQRRPKARPTRTPKAGCA